MKYVPSPYLFIGNRSLNGVQTKIHVIGHPKDSDLICFDVDQACKFAENIAGPSDCQFGFIIVHRQGKNVGVTSGRWGLDDALQIEDAYANDEEHEEMQVNYDGVKFLETNEGKIFAMENIAWIENMMGKRKNSRAYLKRKMPGTIV